MSGKSIISNSYLEDIGDAIRYKKGSEDTYYPSQMGDAIRSIEGIVPSGTLEIDANGTYDVTEYAEAVVDVPDPVVTSLTVTEDGTYEVPSGVDGYNPVTVNTGIDALRSEIDSAVEVSGCDPLVEGLTALTAYANEVTGASDTTLSDAVETLADGYGGAKVYSGTYIPSSDSAAANINTGATGWTHFLIVPHILPYTTSYIRCLGCKYVDFNTRYYLNSFGASSASSTPSACRTVTDDTSPAFANTVQVNGTSITFTGLIASQGGSFQAGTRYDWYAW